MDPRRLPFAWIATLGMILGPQSDDPEDDGSFGLTPPVVCREIVGYEDYVERPDPALTADEKLLLYYRPLHFKTEAVGAKFRAHLVQDGSLRRKGGKPVLWTKTAMVDYEVDSDRPPRLLYIRNTVALKGLRPGEYEFGVTHHDKVGKRAAATRIVPFRVVASPVAEPSEKAPRD